MLRERQTLYVSALTPDKAWADTFMPINSFGEYHVTIVFGNESKNNIYKLKDIVYLLDNVKKALHRDYYYALNGKSME